jgi:integrating conjugative element protein (TIGR03765 family)
MPTFWLACCLASAGGLEAEPQVLHDTGQAISIEPFWAPIKPEPGPAGDLPPPPALTAGGYGLPVTTPSMTPGEVQARSVPALQGKMAGARPLFLIGADRWSMQWLQQNQARLAELHAVGMVVDVDAESDLNILRQTAGQIQLIPASGEAIANELGLQHYPVLIAPPGVIDQ